MQGHVDRDFQRLNCLFRKRKMSSFWNVLKTRKRNKIDSTLNANQFADYF